MILCDDAVLQVLDALQFLHHHGIVHLNIQPDNVIMQSRRRFDVKLVDFGQAHKVTTTDGVKVSRIGTAEFMGIHTFLGCYIINLLLYLHCTVTFFSFLSDSCCRPSNL